jgi:hypothetical protein
LSQIFIAVFVSASTGGSEGQHASTCEEHTKRRNRCTFFVSFWCIEFHGGNRFLVFLVLIEVVLFTDRFGNIKGMSKPEGEGMNTLETILTIPIHN